MNADATTKPAADADPKPAKAKTFTLAQLARELKTDPKLARRKFRANAAKEKPTKLPDPVKSPGRKNTRYEWPDNAHNRKAVTDFLKG